jgi:hypothetical protein
VVNATLANASSNNRMSPSKGQVLISKINLTPVRPRVWHTSSNGVLRHTVSSTLRSDGQPQGGHGIKQPPLRGVAIVRPGFGSEQKNPTTIATAKPNNISWRAKAWETPLARERRQTEKGHPTAAISAAKIIAPPM